MAHGVEEAKQKALFLTRIGQTAYSKLKTLVSPTPLAELDLNTIYIVEKLAEHHHSDTVEIAERFKFFKRQQNDEEEVTDYMAELRKLAKTCNFGSYPARAVVRAETHRGPGAGASEGNGSSGQGGKAPPVRRRKYRGRRGTHSPNETNR